MCISIQVILPTIQNFLLLYSLRCGSILILLWSTFRSLFCIVFFSSAILEMLVGQASPFGAWLVTTKPETDYTHIMYYTLLTLLLCETVILAFMPFLGLGLHCGREHLLVHYLTSRIMTWFVEVFGLSIACLTDKILIGWYLGILFFVILELYSILVVYSYYAEFAEDEKEQ